MRLGTFYAGRALRLGAKLEDMIVDLNLALAGQLARQGERRPYALAAALLPAEMLDFLESGPRALAEAAKVLARVGEQLRAGEPVQGPDGEPVVYKEADVRLAAPVPRPGKTICVAHNFYDMLAETGMKPPSEPRIFGKYANAITGPFDPVVHPRMSQALGYEAELAFIVGTRCKHVPEAKAYEVIAGYTAFNDVSASDLTKKDIQNLRGKSFDTFAPMGPYLVTRDEVPDPHNLAIKLTVNDRVLQDSSTRQMVYNVPQLLAFCSEVFTLEPGDVVATGCPGGLAKDRKPPTFMKPGDLMVTIIEGVGTLRNRIVAEEA